MIFILYDRNFKPLGSPYVLESWRRIQRATDLDDATLIGEKIPTAVEPFVVSVNDKRGRFLFSGLCSSPSIDEEQNKTTIILKDYRTLWNSELIIPWSDFKGSTVGEYLQFLFDLWVTQVDLGWECQILLDADLLGIDWDFENVPLGSATENCSLSTLLSQAITYYDLYCVPSLDIQKRTLTYSFRRCSRKTVPLRLLDAGLSSSEKSFGEFNRVSVYTSDYQKVQEWALTTNNEVTLLPSQGMLVYPAKNRNFIASENTDNAISEAVYDAVMALAKNRYQESIDLSAEQYRSVVDLTVLDFSFNIDVWTEDGFYRSLPVGEIETDSSGRYIVRLGHRIQELTQEI